VTADDVGSYKPAAGHFERFFEVTTADKDHHAHVGASLFHDVEPANRLGLRSVWINRGGADAEAHGAAAEPDRELSDLSGLPDALDELVPAPA
jgi:2-haloacid dehalogenase